MGGSILWNVRFNVVVLKREYVRICKCVFGMYLFGFIFIFLRNLFLNYVILYYIVFVEMYFVYEVRFFCIFIIGNSLFYKKIIS